MKFLQKIKYFLIQIWTIIRKTTGFWILLIGFPVFFLLVYPNWTRKYATNVVYNYKLQNGLWLKRLYERKITKVDGGWEIDSGRTVGKGFIKYRKIYWIEYVIVYWLFWGWQDNDSNYDTCDLGFIKGVLSGEHSHPVAMYFFKERMENFVKHMEKSTFGNSFDLGDRRANNPVKDPVCSWLWYARNTAYNFKYDQYETDENPNFLWTIKGKRFGWIPTEIVDGKQNYHLVFWE